MSPIERKILGALFILDDGSGMVNASLQQIADRISYKKSGGTITYALKMLERDNYIVRINRSVYKILI